MVKLISKNSLIWNDYGLHKKLGTDLKSYYIWSIFYKGYNKMEEGLYRNIYEKKSKKLWLATKISIFQI